MPRFVYNPGGSSNVLAITLGGTGASTAEQAAANLGFVRNAVVGQPNGVLGLDENGLPVLDPKFPTANDLIAALSDEQGKIVFKDPATGKISVLDLPTGAGGVMILDQNGKIHPDYLDGVVTGASYPNISGPAILATGDTGTYTITNFDEFASYNVIAVSGSVSIAGNTVTYIAPEEEGAAGFLINNRKINITVTASGVLAPTITSPVNNAQGISQSPTFTASAFQYFGTAQTQTDVRWELSTDGSFATLVANYEGTSNLNSWKPSQTLTPGDSYYVRVKYKGSSGEWSGWSNTVTFQVVAFTGFVATMNHTNNNKIRAITTDSLGYIYTVGYVGKMPDVPYDYCSTRQLLFTKWTPQGTIVWSRFIAGTADYYGNQADPVYGGGLDPEAIRFDTDGNIYIICSVQKNQQLKAYNNVGGWPYITEPQFYRDDSRAVDHNASAGYALYIQSTTSAIIKFDSGGMVLWTKLYPSIYGFDVFSNTELLISGYFVARYRSTTNDPTTGTFYSMPMDSYNVSSGSGGGGPTYYYFPRTFAYIAKLTPIGTIAWSYIYETNTSGQLNRSRFAHVKRASDGSIYVVGFQSGLNSVASDSSKKVSAVMIKFTNNGALAWKRSLYSGGSVEFRKLAFDTSGNIYAAGYIQETANGTKFALVCKFSSGGAVTWQKRLTGSNLEFFDIAVDSSNDIFVSGVENNAATGKDCYLIKLNASGAILWQRRLVTGAEDGFRDIHIDKNANIYAVGGVTYSTTDSRIDGVFCNIPSDGSMSLGSLAGIPTIYWQSSSHGITDTTMLDYDPSLTLADTAVTNAFNAYGVNTATDYTFVINNTPRLISSY